MVNPAIVADGTKEHLESILDKEGVKPAEKAGLLYQQDAVQHQNSTAIVQGLLSGVREERPGLMFAAYETVLRSEAKAFRPFYQQKKKKD